MYKVRLKIPKEYREMMENLVVRLEKNNVAYSGNNGLIRSFAIQAKQPKNKGHLLFSWNKKWRKSVVTVAPDIKIKRSKNGFEVFETKHKKNIFLE